MNHLLTILTAAGCVAILSGTAAQAMPLGASRVVAAAPLIQQVQLGNGGPIGPGPNGSGNGTGSALGNGAGRGTFGGPTGGRAGPASGLLPNGGRGQPNGSKPAPMRPNGVRKVQ